MNQNPFSLTFGKEPKTIILNTLAFDEIKNNYTSDSPYSSATMITGVRGSGKTVLLTRLCKYFDSLKDWIVVELNPETDMLEYLASSIYEKSKYKYKLANKEFSFSFQGISISLSGENPVPSVISLLEKMLDVLTKKRKKILISIDDVSSNQNVRTFVGQYQIFIRKEYPLFLLMTGLYENVRNLQNERSLTFLYRAPQINMAPLSLISIADSFETILGVSREDSVALAKTTSGYAFAYQVLGFIMFEKKKKKLDDEVLKEFDRYLREYVYEKIYFDLPDTERKIVNSLANSTDGSISAIMEELGINRENISQYRDKLLKKGVVAKAGWGKIAFALPRFKDFVICQQAFD